MSAGSDDERPRPARAAPAKSPVRLALKPKAKTPRAQDDPNFIDLKALKKGTRFTIIASLDETAYDGVSSVSVRMKIDEETGLAVCLEPACGQRCWSNKPESTSFYFALRHAHAFHLPGKFTIISRPLPPAAAAEGGGTTRTEQVTLAPTFEEWATVCMQTCEQMQRRQQRARLPGLPYPHLHLRPPPTRRTPCRLDLPVRRRLRHSSSTAQGLSSRCRRQDARTIRSDFTPTCLHLQILDG